MAPAPPPRLSDVRPQLSAASLQSERPVVPQAFQPSLLISARPARPLGITLLSAFFAFGMLASALAAMLLLFPGSILDAVWRLNPHGHEGFMRIGLFAPPLLGVVSPACGAASFGLFSGRRWGLRLAVVLFMVNLAGDLLNAALGIEPRAAFGVSVVALLLWFLSTATVKAFFAPAPDQATRES